MPRIRPLRYFTISAIVFGCSIASHLNASIHLVTSRTGLAGTDNIDWRDLGPDTRGYGGADVRHPPIVITSDDGLVVTVTQNGHFERLDQFDPATPTGEWGGGWGGNFAPGAGLLWTSGDGLGNGNGPITINFGTTAIEAFGLQIQINAAVPNSFTAQLEAFDSGGNSLGTVTQTGVATGAADNSAPFIGLLSDAPSTDFHSVVVRLIDGPPNASLTNFAINQVDFSPASNGGGVVPEAASFLIWGLLGVTMLIPTSRRPRDRVTLTAR